jgi:regulatory protein
MYNRRKKPVRIPEAPEEAYRAALKTALNIVGYKDNTEAQLREKLTERGYTSETVDDVVAFMTAKGYLNDERMLYRAARLMAEGKSYGKMRIRQELQQKKFRSGLVSTLDWERDELADLDFAEICRKLILKRGGARDEKTYAFLRRYGHTTADIREAYRRLAEETLSYIE